MESTYTVIELSGADPAFEQYKPLVLATWMRALLHGSDFFRMVKSKLFFSVYSKVVMALLKRPEARVRLAVLSDEPDVVVGWCVYEGSVLHFVFVRHQGRRQGIARSLVPKGIMTITHMTRTGKQLWKKKLEHAQFNPF